MTEFKLNVPQDNKRVADIRAGDVLYVTGDIAIARDQAHKKLLETFRAFYKNRLTCADLRPGRGIDDIMAASLKA